jgi:hypothetical protein
MAKKIKSTQAKHGLTASAKVAAGVMGVATLFGACDNGTNSTSSPKVCECPVKIHGSAPCDCGDAGCTCKQKDFTLNYDIPLEDTTGVLNEGHIGVINEYLDLLDSQDPTYIPALKSNSLKIVVITGSNTSKDGGVVSMGINNITNDDFGSAFGTYLGDLLSSINNFNTKIRLANGKTLNG